MQRDRCLYVVANTDEAAGHAVGVVNGLQTLACGGVAVTAPRRDVAVIRGMDAGHVATLVPPGATVVVCGPMHRFLETAEQRVARELAAQPYNVVFLPYAAQSPRLDPVYRETELMRHLVC